MRIATAAVVLATVVSAAAAPAAFAQTRLTDTQFVKVARCAGLAGDTRFDTVFSANKKGRAPFVLDKADEVREAAKREARRAKDGGKAAIVAELSGVCAAYTA